MILMCALLPVMARAQAPQIADTVTFKDTRTAVNGALSTLHGSKAAAGTCPANQYAIQTTTSGVVCASLTNGQITTGLGFTPVATTDPRLTDARTPASHAASHASGGADVVTPAAIGAEPVDANIARKAGASTTNAITVYDANGKLISSGCSIASGVLSCNTGTASSGITLPELTANGTDSFGIYGKNSQAASVCIIMPDAAPAGGQVLSASSTTANTTDGRTCTVMQWATETGGTGQYTSSVPTGPTATGTAGQYSGDATYFYLATATDTWKRVAWDATWLAGAAIPVFNAGTGSYANDQSISITDATSGATICYTTDGSTPAASTPGTCSTGSTYASAVPITATGTVLKAIGTKSGLTNSSVQTATYTLTAANPTDSPGTGSYGSTQSVTLTSSTSAGSIRYTVDNSTPACPSTGTLYSTPISVSVTTTVKAITCKTNYVASGVLSSTYTITGGGTSVSDDFTGSTGTMSTNWSQLGAANIQRNGSGAAACATAWQECLVRWSTTANTFTNDQYSEVVIAAFGGTEQVGPTVRMSSTGTGYWARLGGASVLDIVRRDTGGAVVSLKAAAACGLPTFANGDTVRLDVTGTVLTVKKNGSSVCTYDTTADGTKYASGQPGLYISRGGGGAGATIDSWAGVGQ